MQQDYSISVNTQRGQVVTYGVGHGSHKSTRVGMERAAGIIFSLEYELFVIEKLLESIGDQIAQAQTLIQKLMNNAWSEMVSCSPCFAFYCFFSLHWFTQTIWDNSYPSSDYHGCLILTLFFSCFFLYIFINYEQSNALPSTLPLCEQSKASKPIAFVNV